MEEVIKLSWACKTMIVQNIYIVGEEEKKDNFFMLLFYPARLWKILRESKHLQNCLLSPTPVLGQGRIQVEQEWENKNEKIVWAKDTLISEEKREIKLKKYWCKGNLPLSLSSRRHFSPCFSFELWSMTLNSFGPFKSTDLPVSPYNFLPSSRLSLVAWQKRKGWSCASTIHQHTNH